jgi:hypothetical protein
MATIEEPPTADVAVRLRRETMALRLSFHWLGTRKTLSRSQRTEAARQFDAAGDFLSAGKKILDTTHPRFRQVTAVRHRAQAYVQGISLPYPEPGIRLIRRDDLQEVQDRLTELERELSKHAASLDEAYAELQASAKRQLGRLFAYGDYPASLTDEFGMSWDFPSIDPPDYLRRLSPVLYREEAARVAARFDEAARLAEQMFLTELSDLVGHLSERLSGQDDGKPKIFRDSAVGNLNEFFERFRRLHLGGEDQLEEVVSRAESLLRGVDAQQLRDAPRLRERIVDNLADVRRALDEQLVDQPRRSVMRPR